MEKTSTLLVHFDKGTPALANEIKEAMKKAVMLLLKGETIPNNVDEVVLLLKKEVMKIQNAELENNGEYRRVLLQAMHACAIESPEVASTVVHVLMNFLGDTNVASAMDVVVFVWEIIETNPELRVSIITRLLGTFYQIRAARVCSCALWIIGEYCLSLSEVESGIATIKQCLGDLSFYPPTEEGEGSEAPKPTQPMSNVTTASSRRPVVLADGTYDTQSAALETAMSRQTLVLGSLASHGNLRSLLSAGDFFLGAVIACTLTKLVLRLEGVQPSKTEVNRETTQTLLILVSMRQLGQSSFLPHPIDNDSCDRIVLFIRLLSNTGDETRKIWLQSCRQSFVKMLADKQVPETEERKAKAQVSHAEPDDLDFYHLKSRKGMSQLELEDKVQDDLKRATGEFTKDNDDAKKLNRILQLTGFSDPVYAEAYVTVHDYDIVLDVTVINRTKETLQNLCLELATLGDLKLVEHPQTLAPESSKQIRANIKVSSTETRVIVQNIVYEISNVMERNVFALNNIHIDMMDYISPATCADTAFRTMCAEFESENKGSTPLNFLYPDATEPPTIRVGFVFPGEHSPGGGHNVIWGLHEALKSHNHNNVLLGFICATEGLSAQKTLEITGDILSTYKNHRGYELCRSTKDQISITEQVNAALAACKALKLDGLVVVGGVTANTDAAQLKKTFVADKRRTMVAGVPVNFNGDVKVNFVETNVGVDTICKYYCYFIRLVDLKESQFALESALRSQPNTVILDEELDLDASKLTIPHLANQICEEVQAWAEQDKYHGVIRLPEGLIKRMLPSVHALPQSTREKLLARLVEKEIEKREKAGTYKGKKFNAICHFFGYQAPGSLPSESDCDDANVCGCQAQLLGHICYDLLATELKVYDESQKLSNAEKIHKGNRNERRREQHKMEKEVERAAKKKEEPKSQIEGRARSETIRSQMEELGVKVLPKLPKEKQPKPKKKKEINMNRNVVL